MKGYFEPGFSAYRDIYTLKAGYILQLYSRNKDLKIYPYLVAKFDLDKTNIEFEEALEENERLIKKAVKRQLMADVPLGTLLSGSVDSSLVTLLASKNSPEPVNAFTISFEEKEFNEQPYA